jgi:hypothetical protein
MTTAPRLLSLSLGLGLAACAADTASEEPELTSEAADPASPCGTGRYVTSLVTPTGSRVDFCVFAADGFNAVRESGPFDVRSYLSVLPAGLCADEIHRRIAPDRTVPQELRDACAQASGSTSLLTGDDGAVEEDLRDEGSITVTRPGLGVLDPPPVSYSHYCGGGGDEEFQDERCSLMESNAGYSGWHDSMWWCHASSSSHMQRTATAQIGHKVNKLSTVVAACSGTSQVAMRAKVGGSWNTYIDDSVLSNYYATWSLSSNTSITDYDMQVIADSENGWFFDSGVFGDFLWP